MSPHVLLIADGRSPTAQSWIRNVQALGDTVSLISTFPCSPPDDLRHFFIIPVAFSRLSSSGRASAAPSGGQVQRSFSRGLIRRFAPTFQTMRYILGPLTLPRFTRTFQALLTEIKPDLVHALRIPFEGMLGSGTPGELPFIVSTWGNDLTLHARASIVMHKFTNQCLSRADGFIADTHRDARLAHAWGLSAKAPTLVLPGSGGMDLEAIVSAPNFDPGAYGLPAAGIFVVNPRGLRPKSVHQDTFFAAIPKILARHPNAHFICPGLAGSHLAETWVKRYGIERSTHLLPKLSQPQLWSLLKSAEVFVSPSSHDGTPNSLLEAMACGCFPVAGNIESLREWVEDGVNGLLVEPHSPDALAEAVCRALNTETLRQTAAQQNLAIVKARASQQATRPKISAFYGQFIK